jgi:arabinose-5-phosphate isomerase
VLALSKSGQTREVVQLVPGVRAIGASLIAICGDADTPLGHHADVALELGDAPEACPLGLAPTVSTTMMLALGDALAMAVLEGRELTREEFASARSCAPASRCRCCALAQRCARRSR